MKTIFASSMIRTLLLMIFLLSAGLNEMMAASPKATSGNPNYLSSIGKTALTTPICSGPGCFAPVSKTLSRIPDCNSPGFYTAPRPASRESMNTTAGEIAFSSNLSMDEWGYWEYLGNGVSVRFKIVQRNYENGYPLWTWQFKNDLDSKVTYLEFMYTEYQYSSKEHKDVFPGTLGGGKAFGGWAAFTAVSSRQPSIRIIEIKRQ